MVFSGFLVVDTVDASEILRSPVEVGSLSTIIYRAFCHPKGGFLAGFRKTINSSRRILLGCPRKLING